MSTDFKDVMSKRTDEELIKIVTIDRDAYQPLAVIAAEREIENRNINTVKVEQVESEFKTKIEEKKQLNDKTVNSLIRFVHFIIDTIAWFIIAGILVIILAGILTVISWGTSEYLNPESESFISLIAYTVFLVSYICYYYIMEVKYQKTIAKFITKTKVVTNNGSEPDKGDILARTFCRLIPLDRISFLFSRNGFHDRLSSTQVIKDEKIIIIK